MLRNNIIIIIIIDHHYHHYHHHYLSRNELRGSSPSGEGRKGEAWTRIIYLFHFVDFSLLSHLFGDAHPPLRYDRTRTRAQAELFLDALGPVALSYPYIIIIIIKIIFTIMIITSHSSAHFSSLMESGWPVSRKQYSVDFGHSSPIPL